MKAVTMATMRIMMKTVVNGRGHYLKHQPVKRQRKEKPLAVTRQKNHQKKGSVFSADVFVLYLLFLLYISEHIIFFFVSEAIRFFIWLAVAKP